MLFKSYSCLLFEYLSLSFSSFLSFFFNYLDRCKSNPLSRHFYSRFRSRFDRQYHVDQRDIRRWFALINAIFLIFGRFRSVHLRFYAVGAMLGFSLRDGAGVVAGYQKFYLNAIRTVIREIRRSSVIVHTNAITQGRQRLIYDSIDCSIMPVKFEV